MKKELLSLSLYHFLPSELSKKNLSPSDSLNFYYSRHSQPHRGRRRRGEYPKSSSQVPFPPPVLILKKLLFFLLLSLHSPPPKKVLSTLSFPYFVGRKKGDSSVYTMQLYSMRPGGGGGGGKGRRILQKSGSAPPVEGGWVAHETFFRLSVLPDFFSWLWPTLKKKDANVK